VAKKIELEEMAEEEEDEDGGLRTNMTWREGAGADE
jgi:hypothetical protein